MDPFLLITGVLAGVSLILMIRNTYNSTLLPFYRPFVVNSSENEKEIKMKLGSKEYKGYLLTASELPRASKDIGKKIIRALKASNTSATIINGIYLVEKDKLLKDLDDRIKKLELIYESTKLIKYKKRLEVLKEIYSKVADIYKPYIGGLELIVWSDSKPKVEALKSLLEIELGVTFKEESINDLAELLAPPAKLIYGEEIPLLVSQDSIGLLRGVIIGKNIETDDLVILKWPQDFERHVGIIGPTGRGKTVLLAGIATQLSTFMINERDPMAIIVIDPKGDLTRLIENIADKIEKVECLPEVKLSSELVKRLFNIVNYDNSRSCKPIRVVDEGLQVFDLSNMDDGVKDKGMMAVLLLLIEKHLETNPKGRRVVLVDEAWRLKDRGLRALETIIREGRSRLLHIVYAIHDIDDVNSILLNNTSTLILFGGPNEEYAEKAEKAGLLNAKDILPELMIGEAMIRSADNEINTAKIFNFEELLLKNNNDWLEVVKTVDIKDRDSLKTLFKSFKGPFQRTSQGKQKQREGEG